jgi:predicted anti-sigma-YlaC factor YlaD
MRHEITSELWEDYLEGDLTLAERSRIEAHLRTCVACRALATQLTNCTARLHETAEKFDAIPVASATKVDSAWQAMLLRMSVDETPLQQRLDELEAAMTVLCGSHTAARALHAAAAESPARSLTRLTHENWDPFLQSLLAIAQALCGRTGARLILESGQL